MQPSDFTGISWLDVDEICPGGPCLGKLPGSDIDLTGYSWASANDVSRLFASYPGLRAFLEEPRQTIAEDPARWATQFFEDFDCIVCESSGGSLARLETSAFTRDERSGSEIVAASVTDVVGNPGDTAAIKVIAETFRKNERYGNQGHWFWKPAEPLVPPPVVERAGRQWVEVPSEFVAYSWREISEVCPDGQCFRALAQSPYDLTGFTWASLEDVRLLFGSYVDDPGLGAGTSVFTELDSEWAPDIIEQFGCTACASSGKQILEVLTSMAETDDFVRGASVVDGPGVDTLSFVRGGSLDERDDEVGHIFWRPLQQDQPPGPGDVQEGVSAACELAGNPTVSRDNPISQCDVGGGAVRAFADGENGIIRVASAAPDPLLNPDEAPVLVDDIAEASLLDLVTVTDGFDAAGLASGHIELDIGGMIEESFEVGSWASFLVVIWYSADEAPECISDAEDCGLDDAGFDFAQVLFEVVDSDVVGTIFEGDDGGEVVIQSRSGADLQSTLSVPWQVDEGAPSFWVGIYGIAAVSRAAGGSVDFDDTAVATIDGPEGLEFSAKNGLLGSDGRTQPKDAPVRLSGDIENEQGTKVIAMVLASGRYQFSNSPAGSYELDSLPREPDDTVRRQIYASGFVPRIDVVRGSTAERVVLQSSGQCPDYNAPSLPAARPESAGQSHSLSGRILVQDTDSPVRAMVLVNGQYDFADSNGHYLVEFSLDSQGQFTRQVYATGFAPSIETYDASTTSLDVRLARSSECE